MTKLSRINPAALAPPPENKHAHIVVAPAGARLAFIAGQVAFDRAFNLICHGDVGALAKKCFANVRDCLTELDARPDQIAEMTIIVVRYEPAMLDAINAAGADVFGADWPVSATTLIGAQALGGEDFLVEIRAIVAL